MNERYEAILNTPRPVSKRHRMSISDRAAQFAPFAALTGYGAAVRETGRLTDSRIELDEYEKAAINEKLSDIAARVKSRPHVQITYFLPDEKKSGGAYTEAAGTVKKMDVYARTLIFTDGTVVPFDDILAIHIP